MALAVKAGRRVVLVTCTRGEMGEIVVPEMDTPDNHRRLGEIRAGELERAMGHLGVTEWENLGYKDSDMMGRAGNRDARCFWQADIDEAIGRLVFLVRTYRPDVMTTYNDVRRLRPPRPHPDAPRRGRRLRAGRRPDAGTRSSSRRSTAGPARPRARAGSRRGRRPSSTSRRSPPRSATRCGRADGGDRRALVLVAARRTRRPSRSPSSRRYVAKMLVAGRGDHDLGRRLARRSTQRWAAIQEHVTQITTDNPFVRFGRDAWAEFWNREAYIRARVAGPGAGPGDGPVRRPR